MSAVECPECQGEGLIGADAKAECSNCGGTGNVATNKPVTDFEDELNSRTAILGARAYAADSEQEVVDHTHDAYELILAAHRGAVAKEVAAELEAMRNEGHRLYKLQFTSIGTCLIGR